MKLDHAAILAAIKAHATTKIYAEIAELMGVSRATVRVVARKAGFKKPQVPGRRRAKDAHMRKVILAHVETHSLARIGRLLGVTGGHVGRLCKTWRIKRRNFSYSPLRHMSRRALRKLVRQPAKLLKEVASEAGVHPTVLTRELRRRGIKPLTRRERNARLLKRGMRICSRCQRTKPIEQFTRSANHSSGYSNRCLECGRAYINARRKREANAKR
ncbi:MAG: hypothetical protein NTY01_07850 [Verrucomicrobia bacterium]|nr:hypothetical protein [Verrucomicrobiota bacterium]